MGLKEDICFVSVGQCGGNIGLLFEKSGYDVLYLNTAMGDLETLKGAQHMYKIPNSRGCNQDPDKGAEIYSLNHESIMEHVDRFANKRLVIFICSAGGGSGGGMTPLMLEHFLERLKIKEDAEWEVYDQKCELDEYVEPPVSHKVGLITCIPSISESPQLNANAYNFFKQITNLTTRALAGEISNFATTFIIDNECNGDILELNNEFVSLFNEFISMPKTHKDVRGNVDDADLESAMFNPGVCILSKVPGAELETQSILQSIKHSNVFAPIENAAGLYWVTSTTEPINSIALEKELGAPRTIFSTYNNHDNYFLISGLSFPVERLSIMAERAREFLTQTVNSQKAIANTYLEDDLSFINNPIRIERVKKPVSQMPMTESTTSTLEAFGASEQSAPKTEVSIQDKLKKFKAHRR